MPYLDWVVEPISFVETFVVAFVRLAVALHITPLSPWRGVGGEAIRGWS